MHHWLGYHGFFIYCKDCGAVVTWVHVPKEE
jgi:hypothetical protein